MFRKKKSDLRNELGVECRDLCDEPADWPKCDDLITAVWHAAFFGQISSQAGGVRKTLNSMNKLKS